MSGVVFDVSGCDEGSWAPFFRVARAVGERTRDRGWGRNECFDEADWCVGRCRTRRPGRRWSTMCRCRVCEKRRRVRYREKTASMSLALAVPSSAAAACSSVGELTALAEFRVVPLEHGRQTRSRAKKRNWTYERVRLVCAKLGREAAKNKGSNRLNYRESRMASTKLDRKRTRAALNKWCAAGACGP